jgi:hypothetical protein
VPAVNPIKFPVKVPVVVPSVVLALTVVGLADVLQHIPLTVITEPPLEEMVPPETAVV